MRRSETQTSRAAWTRRAARLFARSSCGFVTITPRIDPASRLRSTSIPMERGLHDPCRPRSARGKTCAAHPFRIPSAEAVQDPDSSSQRAHSNARESAGRDVLAGGNPWDGSALVPAGAIALATSLSKPPTTDADPDTVPGVLGVRNASLGPSERLAPTLLIACRAPYTRGAK